MCHSGNTSSIKAELDGKICSENTLHMERLGAMGQAPENRVVQNKHNPQYKKERENIFTRQT